MTNPEELRETHRLATEINQKLDAMAQKLTRLVVAIEMVSESFDDLPSPEAVAPFGWRVGQRGHRPESPGDHDSR